MRSEKFQTEVKTLEMFFTKYCNDGHSNQLMHEYDLRYRGSKHDVGLFLCKECHELVSYSFARLGSCPHEVKPRCRNCPNPCYEKKQWKQLQNL